MDEFQIYCLTLLLVRILIFERIREKRLCRQWLARSRCHWLLAVHAIGMAERVSERGNSIFASDEIIDRPRPNLKPSRRTFFGPQPLVSRKNIALQ